VPPYISVADFDRLQHYKDRNPPWIKLYNDLLDSYEFTRLQDASKWLAVGIMLLASRMQNKVPADPAWIAQRLGCTNDVDLQPLITIGFIVAEQDAIEALANSQQPAPKRERQRESKRQTKTEGDGWKQVPAGWEPKDRHKARAAELKLDLDRQVRKYKAHDFDKVHTDPDRSFDKWLEQAAEFHANRNAQTNGNGRNGAARQDARDWRYRREGESARDDPIFADVDEC